MPYTERFYYPESNPFKVGDTVFWKGKPYKVGADANELNKWGKEETHIVTTCGKVLCIDELDGFKDYFKNKKQV